MPGLNSPARLIREIARPLQASRLQATAADPATPDLASITVLISECCLHLRFPCQRNTIATRDRVDNVTQFRVTRHTISHRCYQAHGRWSAGRLVDAH